MLNVMLGTKFIRGTISNLISRSIRKKTGYKMDVSINDMDIREGEGGLVTIKLDTEVTLDRRELEKIINSIRI